MLRTSPPQSAKNLSLLVDVAEDAEVAVSDGDYKKETDERSPRFENLNKITSYLNPNTKKTFIQLR